MVASPKFVRPHPVTPGLRFVFPWWWSWVSWWSSFWWWAWRSRRRGRVVLRCAGFPWGWFWVVVGLVFLVAVVALVLLCGPDLTDSFDGLTHDGTADGLTDGATMTARPTTGR